MRLGISALLALTASAEAFWFNHDSWRDHRPFAGGFPVPWVPGHRDGHTTTAAPYTTSSRAASATASSSRGAVSTPSSSSTGKNSTSASSKTSAPSETKISSVTTSSSTAHPSTASVSPWSGPTVGQPSLRSSSAKTSAFSSLASSIVSSSRTTVALPSSSSSSKPTASSFKTITASSSVKNSPSASGLSTKSTTSPSVKPTQTSSSNKSSLSKKPTSVSTRASDVSIAPSPGSFTTRGSSSSKSSISALSSSSPLTGACSSTVTKLFTITATPATTITYEIDHGTDTYNGDDFVSIPQFVPSTVYPTTVYTNAATSTATVIITPTTTVGAYSTVRIPTPSGFRNIQDTLPGWYDEGLGSPDPANKKRQAGCVATVSVTKTVYASTTLTATTVTTLTGAIYAYPQENTKFDQAGGAAFGATYTGPVTTTATTPRTITTSYQTTVTTTVVLPLQTVTGTTSTIYEVCRTQNQAIAQTSPAAPSGGSCLLTNTAPIKLDGYFGSAYDCCAAAVEYGGVAFWQYNPLGCQVQRAPNVTDNNCVQANYGASVNYFGSCGAGNSGLLSRLTGNGLCGQVDAAVLYPAAGTGTGGS